MWMFGSRTTVKKVRNSLTWFSHLVVAPSQAFQFSLILAMISRYLTFAWVTLFMRVLATVGHKVSNYRKYGILRAAEEVVRAGVLSYAPGSESVHMFHLSHFHRLVSFCWFGFGCWGGFVCFAVAFFLFTDQSVRSSCQPMTSLAYLHDCHSRYDERSIVQKKKYGSTALRSLIYVDVGGTNFSPLFNDWDDAGPPLLAPQDFESLGTSMSEICYDIAKQY